MRTYRRGRPAPRNGDTSGRTIRRAVVGGDPAAARPPGRVHQLAKMRLIDLIALYQSMLPVTTAEHGQVARTAPDTWTKDQVVTAIRQLEAPRAARVSGR
jgi:hypothetical protein